MVKGKTKRELFIGLGFVLEVFLFMFTGLLCAYLSWLSVGFFILAVFVAVMVGKKIVEDARERLKEELRRDGVL